MLIIYMRIVNSLDQKLKAHKSAILTEFFSLQTYENSRFGLKKKKWTQKNVVEGAL